MAWSRLNYLADFSELLALYTPGGRQYEDHRSLRETKETEKEALTIGMAELKKLGKRRSQRR